MGRGRLGSQQGVQRTLAARQPAAAAVSVSPADAIRESLRTNGTMDLASFSKLSDDDMAAILNEIDQYESDSSLDNRLLRPSDTQRFFNQIGWTDEKPEILDERAYEKARAAAGAKSLYHTDQPLPGRTTQTMLNQFRKGTRYLSGGYHGDGTYLAELSWDSWGYGGGEHTARQQKMFLNKHAKIIQERDLDQRLNAWQTSHPKAWYALRHIGQGYGSRASLKAGGSFAGSKSVFAAMLGYNVIQSGDYYTLLNRKAVTVSKTHRVYGKIDNGQRHTDTW